MARTIDQIQQSIIDNIQADPVLSVAFTSTSKTAIWRLLTRVVAVAFWGLEVLFDTVKAEVLELLDNLKPHNTRWYAQKARAFQYGYSLPADTDKYDNSLLTEEQIEDSQIVKYAAVTEGEDGRLRIKVATEGADLEPLTEPQLEAFSEYMKRIKDAGVRLNINSLPADKLKLGLKIYYDPLILNGDGQRIDGTSLTPVKDAVDTFLKNLPFNGVFVLAYLVDALQQVEGIIIPHIVTCETAYGALAFTTVNVQYLPDAGYLRFENEGDLTIEYIPQSPLL
jgi:hypothetical protein